MDKECQDWQAKVTEAQTRVNAAGRDLAHALEDLEKQTKAYQDKLSVDCDEHCPTGKCE